MKSIVIKKKSGFPLFIIPSGLAAGFLNGLLGAGAGVILVFVYAALSKRYNGTGCAKDTFAMTVATVIPISVFSAVSYAAHTQADFSKGLIFLIPAALGGIIGAVITDKISEYYLKLIFAVITVIAGINMLLR